MFDMEDNGKEIMDWVADNITEMSLVDQLKIIRACMNAIEVSKELYEKYNRPKPNRYFFMP